MPSDFLHIFELGALFEGGRDEGGAHGLNIVVSMGARLAS
jgi:hypothetical protein